MPEFVYVSSGVIYPEESDGPITEAALFDGRLEPANEGYGLAKIVGGMRAPTRARSSTSGTEPSPPLISSARETFHSARPPHRRRDREDPCSHGGGGTGVEVWGDGTARREFTFVDDLAEWVVGDARLPRDPGRSC